MRRNSVWLNLGATITLGCMLLFGLAQIAYGQAPTPLPLSLENNYMVTGDYVVGGWNKMGSPTTINGTEMSTGTITIPDPKAYATTPQQIPAGADIVAAYLYWATVENSGVHSGQNGLFSGTNLSGTNTPPIYPISGTILGNPNAPVSWSSGGCAGAANGSKTIVTYRAEISALLPVDGSGAVLRTPTLKLSLPDTGNAGQPPFALGATLVIVYRLLAPSVPLNAVIIYDGAYAPSNTAQTMTQPMIGFYDAGNDQGQGFPIATKITHIVANGQNNKFQSVALNGVNLPSIYGNLPPFPGQYNGTWDNPTFFPPNGAVKAGDASATTSVVPASSNKGCVSWSAIVMSTTVQDTDHDGLPDAWKTNQNQGYYDAGAFRGMSNQGTCTLSQGACMARANDPSWVALPGATPGEQDIFIQLDYMCTKVIPNPNNPNISDVGTCDPSGVSYKPSQQAINNLVSAFSSNGHNVNVHVIPDDNNVILAELCADTTVNGVLVYCPHPGQAGVVDFKLGYAGLKAEPINYPNEAACESAGSLCVRRFPPGQNNSYHEAIFAVASAAPNWYFLNGSLTSVGASGNTLTFTTPGGHGLAPDPTNMGIPNGRITISGAISNPSLNGTYLVQSATATTFTIQLATATTAPTQATDPYFAVASAVVNAGSGLSDIGGADSVISLGLWGVDGQTVPVESGTFMHELGHTLGLTHGGLYRTDLGGGNYSFSFEPNCKSNFQSVMNYMFQVDLLDGVLDYSEQVLPTLSENAASPASVLASAIHPTTQWYAPNQSVGSPAQAHCDGTPLLTNPPDPPTFRLQGPVGSITWAANQDINFDGQTEAALDGYSDWANIDLRQIGATANGVWAAGRPGVSTTGGGRPPSATTGGGRPPSATTGGGRPPSATTGGGVGEITYQAANSIVRSPTGAAATLTPANSVQVSFVPPGFGQSLIASFNIYRSANGAPFGATAYANFSLTGMSLPLPTTLTPPADTKVSCDATYSYFVTTVLSDGRESVPSNTTASVTTPACTTSVVVTSSANPSTFGQSVTFTATVTDTTSTTTPTGSVQFYFNGTACGGLLPLSGTTAPGSTSAALIVSSPSCTTTLGVSGSPYTVKAVYSNADGNFNGSSGTLAQTVNPAPTSTTVSSSANPSIFGQSVVFTATVANTAGPGISTATPTGSVQFSIDGAPFGAAVPLSGSGATASGNSGATATLMVNGSPHTVKAVYSNADGNFNVSSGTLAQTVKPAPTSTTVTSSANPSMLGQSVTFTATVANTAGPGISIATPTGSIQFMDGAAPLGTAQIVSGLGTATLVTSALAAGTHPITAIYSNSDGNFLGSTSAIFNQVVQDFSITVTPSAQTIPSGHQAIYTITITPIGGLTGTVALSCIGTPPNSTCSISPSSDNLQGSPIASTVTLNSNQNVNHGTFTLTFTGAFTGGNLNHSTTVQLTVK